MANYRKRKGGLIMNTQLKELRTCEHCNSVMYEGYVLGYGYYFCSEQCILDSETEETENLKTKKDIEDLFEEIEGTCYDDYLYWTQWESEYFDY